MDTKTFLENFGHIADAPNGVQKLRELVLQLAISGRLSKKEEKDKTVNQLTDEAKSKKEEYEDKYKIRKTKPLPELDDKEILFDVPEHWKWLRIDDVASYIQRGKGPKYVDKSNAYVVSQKCVQWSGFDITRARNVDEKSLDSYGVERFLVPGDLLWNSTGTGTVGRINVFPADVEGRVVADSHVTVIRLSNLEPRYIWCFIASPWVQPRIEPGHEDSLVSGTTKQVELNTSSVKALPIPIPPLEEQKRIVAKVDQLMALCDQLETQQKQKAQTRVALNNAALDKLLTAKNPDEFNRHWQRIANNFHYLYDNVESLTNLRAAILDLAVHGKLIPHLSGEEPASKSFDKFYDYKGKLISEKLIPKKSKQKDIPFDIGLFPEHWELFKWNEISHWITYGFTRPMPHHDKGIPIITGKNVCNSNIDMNNVHYTDKASFKSLSKKDKPEKGDILITKDGSIGRTAIVGDEGEFCINQSVAVMWLKNMPADRRYLQLVIDSPISQNIIQEHSKGQAIKHLSITDFGNMICPMPPLEEQKRIVAKVDQLMALCDQLQTKLKQTQTTSEKLVTASVSALVA